MIAFFLLVAPLVLTAAPVPASKGDALPPGAILRLGTTRFRHAQMSHSTISADGRQLITLSSSSKTIKVWSLATGAVEREMTFSSANLHGFAWSPDGKTFATLASEYKPPQFEDGILQIHDATTGNSIRTVAVKFNRSSGRTPIRYLPDGKHVAVQVKDALSIRDLETGGEVKSQPYNGGQYEEFAVSHDGKRMLMLESYNAIVWDWETGSVKTWRHPAPLRIKSASFSPDGKQLALIGDIGGPISLVDADTGTLIHDIKHPTKNRISASAVFSPDGSTLFTNDDGGRNFRDPQGGGAVLGFEVATGKLVKEWPNSKGAVGELTLAADHRTLISLSFGYPRWDITTGERTNQDNEADGVLIESLQVSAGKIMTLASDQKPHVWNEDTGKLLYTIDHLKSYRAATFSPDGQRIATGGSDDRIIIWNANTGTRLMTLPGHTLMNGLDHLRFSPDSNQLASFGMDFFLRVTDLKSGKAIREFAIRPPGLGLPDTPIMDRFDSMRQMELAMVNPAIDGQAKWMAISLQKNHFIYAIESGKLVRNFTVPQNGFPGYVAPVFGINEDVLYTLDRAPPRQIPLPGGLKRHEESKENPLRCWDLKSGELQWESSVTNRFGGRLVISPDGKWLAFPGVAEGPSESVEFYSTKNGVYAGKLTRLPSPVQSLVFSADGKRIILAMSDKTALVYPVPPLTPVSP